MPEPQEPKERAYPGERPQDPSPASLRSAPSPQRGEGGNYAELHALSNFTFLRGASHPDELAQQAAAMGCAAVAVTDVNSLAGIVRAHVAAKEAGIRLVVGVRLKLGGAGSLPASTSSPERVGVERRVLPDTPSPHSTDLKTGQWHEDELELLIYPTDRPAYGRLCRLLTRGKRRAPKGQCWLTIDDLVAFQDGLLAVVLPPETEAGLALPITERFVDTLAGLKRVFDDDRLSLAAARVYGPDDQARLARLDEVSCASGVPLVATNAVHYHVAERRRLQDVLTCIRHGVTIEQAGALLLPNGERFIKGPEEMGRLFADRPAALARTVEIADRARFSLDEIKYEYPEEVCPAGRTPMQYLRELTWRGAAERFGKEATKRRSDRATKGEVIERQRDEEMELVEPGSGRL